MKENKNDKLENFTPIENYMLEEAFFKYNFTSYEIRILFVIMRYTWGYRNSENKPNLAYSYISDITGIDRAHIVRTIKGLKDKNIIKQYKTKEYINQWHINCKYSQWEKNQNQSKDETRIMNHRHDESMAAVPDQDEGSSLSITPSGFISRDNYKMLLKDKPQRENYNTNKEFDNALKWFEIEKGLYKPTKRDFPKEPDKYLKAIELYTKGAAALEKYIIKPLII